MMEVVSSAGQASIRVCSEHLLYSNAVCGSGLAFPQNTIEQPTPPGRMLMHQKAAGFQAF